MTARWLLWLVLAVWALFALTFGALQLFIVPRINDWRPELERWATKAVGIPVQVGGIAVYSEAPQTGWRPAFMPSLVPAFELSDVRLFDPAGREALHLPRVQASLSVTSIWRLGFEQIVIAGPVLDVRRTADGRIEVAGLDMSGPEPDNHSAANWFFDQSEFVIRQGTVRWTDDLRGLPTLSLTALDLVTRNGTRSHDMRLDATPPADFGERFTLRAQMREPLLDLVRMGASQGPPWQRWSGELYADFPQVDVARLRARIDLLPEQLQVSAGRGQLRAWADLASGRLTGATAELQLNQVNTRLGAGLPELTLDRLSGRFVSQWSEAGFEASAQGLQFSTADGLSWPASALRVKHRLVRNGQPAQTELEADRIDLAALAAVAGRVPLPEAGRTLLAELRPSGQLESLSAAWDSHPGQTGGTPAAAGNPNSASSTAAAPGNPNSASSTAAAPGNPNSASSTAAPGNASNAGSTTAASPASPLPAIRYRASGRVADLSLASRPAQATTAAATTTGAQAAGAPASAAAAGATPPTLGRPGVAGASGEFDFNQDGGTARLNIRDGAIELPGMFEDPRIPLARFDGQTRWQLAGERIDVWLEQGALANTDAEGSVKLHWHTSDPASSRSGARFPGVLDLTARLTRGQATQVHRYLPLALGQETRRYLREAVRGGTLGTTDFRVSGDLWDLPYNLSGTRGEFRISAQLRELDFDYLPSHLQAAGDTAWPGLRGVSGQLLLERASLQLTNLTGGVAGATGVRLQKGEVGIADLAQQSVLTARATAVGPAGSMLDFVRRSPVNGFTSEALAQASASGPAQLQFQLRLPLQQPADTTVQGSVQLTGNDVQISPDSPLLGRASGTVNFSESGFSLSDARARLFGGELRFEGGLQPNPQGQARLAFRGQGSASAAGLREGNLGFVSRLFGQASGSAAYSAELGFRAGVPELQVTSDLQGMAVSLPAPLNKAASDSLPLRYDNKVVEVLTDASGEVVRTDRLAVTLGNPRQPLAAIQYERDITGTEPRVVRGSIAAGLDAGESVLMPAEGVQANLRSARIDADAWERTFNALAGAAGANPAPSSPPASTASTASTGSAASAASLGYLPTTIALRADQLQVTGRSFNRLLVGGSRLGNQWRLNVNADELNGYIEVRQAAGNSAGNVFARLAFLNLAPAAAADVEQLLQQPSSMPALDIAVQDLVLSNRKLGRVEIEAQNRGGGVRSREWRLTRLVVDVPEAQLEATGNWAFADGLPGAERRTALDFKLDIQDAGMLLTRFSRPGVVRGGKGQITGNIAWVGSPMSLDMPSLSGRLKVDVQTGQFLKVEPGAAKLLGVLSLQALPRRLVLDFRDVFSEGFAFDFLRGDASVQQGVAQTNNLQMKGINAAVLMEGSADIVREQQDLKVVVVPELNAGTAALIATAINPAVGIGTFLAQFLLRQPLQSVATQQFQITGSWADPQVERR